MDLGSSFVVPAPRAVVFQALLDPVVMRACIPGCEELERDGERAYRGRLQSEIAHVRFNAAFSATVTEFDEPVRLRALLQGEDRRIASSIRMDVVLEVAERGEESELSYRMELALWGRIGRLGEAIVRRRSAEVQQEFEAALLEHLAATSPFETKVAEPAGSPVPSPQVVGGPVDPSLPSSGGDGADGRRSRWHVGAARRRGRG